MMRQTEEMRRAIMTIVGEIVEEKRRAAIFPDYATMADIREAMADTLDELVDEGRMARAIAGINRIEAYSLSDED